jgi:long-chain acyl-CoA synthetase
MILEPEKPVCEYIRDWAEIRPEAVALSFYGRDITYAELNGMVDRLAWALAGIGVKKGDRVAIHMENCPQFVISYFAAQRAGGVVVAVNPMFKGAELEYELNDAGVETLIGVDGLYAEVKKIRNLTPLKNVILTSMKDFLSTKPVLALPEEAGHDKQSFPDTVDFMELLNKSDESPMCKVTDLKKDLALLQYTGGTTGTPKGAMISHNALTMSSIGAMHWYHFRENDVFLGVTPFFHVMGQSVLMCAPVVCGGRIVILSRFVPEVVAQAIGLYRCTFWVGATTMVIALINLPNVMDYDFTSFRAIWTGGASVSVELQKKLKELAPEATIGEGYGLSETITQGGAITPLFRYKPGYLGIPQIGGDIRIMDREAGTRELAPNEEGEIVLRRQHDGRLLEQTEETKQVLRNGWLYTGDTGRWMKKGISNSRKRKGTDQVFRLQCIPAEVEDLLYRHPAVKEVAVIGVSDAYRGESVKAFIVPKEEYAGTITEQEILNWSRDNMAAYKRPKFIEFREALPKSGTGKLLRRILVGEEKAKSQEAASKK